MTKREKDTTDLLNELRESYTLWEKIILHENMNWLRWLIYNLPDAPRDIYLSIKWFIQRGRRGYADCDVWSLDYYLSNVIANAVKDLRIQAHGVPCDYASKDGMQIDMRAWKKVLKEIEWTFRTNCKISERDWDYLTEKQRTAKRLALNKMCKIRTMTKQQCKRHRDGWKLFKKYYYNLWD